MAPRDGIVVIYTFAAFFALAAAYFWMRFAQQRQRLEREGGPATTRWMTEAGSATAVTLFLAGGGYLLSLLV